MARARSQDQPVEGNWKPTQAVENPILNNPYEEPRLRWDYRKGEDGSAIPEIVQGRREAAYFFKTAQRVQQREGDLFASQSQFEEQEDKLALPNRLREDVRRWRDNGYRGASSVTRELFRYWFRAERARRMFFCQREAVETLIYLLELGLPGRLGATGYKNFGLDQATLGKLLAGERCELSVESDENPIRLVDAAAEADLLPLVRLGCRMATGSGKTLVMAMAVTWAFCNRGVNPASTHFPNGVLVCAPNLTVKKRLAVLQPEHPQNYYRSFDLVPARYATFLAQGKVLVTNWHGFAPQDDSRRRSIVQRGEESNDAFAKNRLGALAERMPLLVFNDEGHHCWRPKAKGALATAESADELRALQDEVEEARIWLAGLDRINNAGLLGKEPQGQLRRGVLAAVDLSATPFYLAASGYPEGSPFPWLVTSFGLMDAIESGIVKVPRLPVLDDQDKKDEIGRPDPQYFRLWKHINEKLSAQDRSGKKPKSDRVYAHAESALVTLASQWKTRFDSYRAAVVGGSAIPPVLIVVCDNTELSELVYEKISGERREDVAGDLGKSKRTAVFGASAILPEFTNEENVRHTVRIDSKLLAKLEVSEGENKDLAAEALRKLIDTVGKPGELGEYVRCVVSVSMLTEGWDANNVTHILGIRAFGSQLLCEQVVGRGLRRMSYDVGPDGLLAPEYVDVYGIPFSLVPFKGKSGEHGGDDKPQQRIFAMPEREALLLQMPAVEGYTYDLRDTGIHCNVDSLEGMVVDEEPNTVWLRIPRGGEERGLDHSHEATVRQTREEYYKATRYQQILFRVAQQIVDDLVSGAYVARPTTPRPNEVARHRIFPSILHILRLYVDSKVEFKPGVDRRELGLEKYARILRERVREGIVALEKNEKAPLLPICAKQSEYFSTAGVDYVTTLPIRPIQKSHLNAAALRSMGSVKGGIGENVVIEVLEDMESVEAFAPNDCHIGFVIPYEYQENDHLYEPDFVVRMRGGKKVLLEVKGRKGEMFGRDQVFAKNTAARKWVEAVNNSRKYGTWAFEIAYALWQVRPLLNQHAADETLGTQGARILPFRRVEPEPERRWVSAVPLVSLRAAAGKWSAEQYALDEIDDFAEDWVEFERKKGRGFEKGMFVARVDGLSMEPEIPSGSYCLFRSSDLFAQSEGKIVLAWHEGTADPETGGMFTVKRLQRVERGLGKSFEIVTELQPANPDFAPLVVRPGDPVRVLAECLEVLG